MKQSRQLFKQAKKLFPGGVNSPVRAFSSVGANPLVFKSANGAYLTSVENEQYLDFVMSWGPALLGHSHKKVTQAIKQQVDKGICFGMCSELEIKLAQIISKNIPQIPMMRFVSSGTEATMSALRLARGYTKKDNIIKFEGCYHGHSDGLLVKAGSGGATFGVTGSAGVPKSYAQHTISLPYNNLQACQEIFSKHKIAGVILEPIAGNMGLIEADKDFLQGLRKLCDQYKAVLIFDEVMCGFRVSKTVSSLIHGVDADLYCFGKVIGGGTNIGAFGGKEQIMQNLAPQGGVYQAGTLSGNPLTMRAGVATLQILFETKAFDKIQKNMCYFSEQIKGVIAPYNDVIFHSLGSMFTLFFHKGDKIENFDDVNQCDFKRFSEFFQFMLGEKILIPPSQYEANFLSLAHRKKDLDKYINALKKFLKK